MATLYHWDLPQSLEDRGGWTNRDTAEHFADLAAATYARLGDRVATWTTLNEPWCSAFLGYASGDHAPGRRDPGAAFQAAHHLLLGHGLAVRALRGGGAKEVSITLNLTPVSPQDPESKHDVAAAARIDGLHNRLFLDPLLRGAYPADMRELAGRFTDLSHLRDGDEAIISAPIDLLGVNYYQPKTVTAAIGAPASKQFPGSEGVAWVPHDGPKTAMDWPIDADGLYALLTRLAADYPNTPLMITENGAAFADSVHAGDGVHGNAVHDTDRIEFLQSHLRAAHGAIAAGVDLRGYLAWSLMDNFEWAYGYDKRFGIVYVDYATQERLPKDSALWYRGVIADNAV